MKVKSLLVAFLLLSCSSALAVVEIRAGYGLNNSNPTVLNDFFKAINAKAVSTLPGTDLDLIISLPGSSFGFGARQENHTTSAKSTSNGTDYKYSLSYARTSFLMNYRFVNTLVYLGPIATVGIVNQAEYTLETGTNSKDTYSNTNTTYSAGFEGGFKLGLFLFGVEAGQFFGDFGPAEKNGTAVNHNGKPVQLDFTGMYYKVLIGLSI